MYLRPDSAAGGCLRRSQYGQKEERPAFPPEAVRRRHWIQGRGGGGKARRGELMVVIGVNEDGDVIPLGTCSDRSWPEISREWRNRNIRMPAGGMLVCDGEPGLRTRLQAMLTTSGDASGMWSGICATPCDRTGEAREVPGPIRKGLRELCQLSCPGRNSRR